MAITLNLAPEVEEAVRAEAERTGVSLEEYLVEKTCLMGDHCHRRTPPVETARTEAKRQARARSGHYRA